MWWCRAPPPQKLVTLKRTPCELTGLQYSCDNSAIQNSIQECFQNLMCYYIYLLRHTIQAFVCYCYNQAHLMCKLSAPHQATCSMQEAQLLSLLNIRQATANRDQMFAFSSTSNISIHFRWANEGEGGNTQEYLVTSLYACDQSNFLTWHRAHCRRLVPFQFRKQHFSILKYI